MLVARELLNLIRVMVEEFRREGNTAVPFGTIQAQYIAIVCMLRSVGHVLEKVDCADEPARIFLRSRWSIWKKEGVFQNFIEPTRNELLKEFKGGLRLKDADDVSSVFYANPSAPGGATAAHLFEPQKLRDKNDRLVLPLFQASIVFWEICLKEVEGRLANGTLSRTGPCNSPNH